MKKIKKLLVIVLSMVMLFGGVLTVNAATLRNNWCCPGAADKHIYSGEHTCIHNPHYLHPYSLYYCFGCNEQKDVCEFRDVYN